MQNGSFLGIDFGSVLVAFGGAFWNLFGPRGRPRRGQEAFWHFLKNIRNILVLPLFFAVGASQVGLEKGFKKTHKSIFSVLNFGFDFGSILGPFGLHFGSPKMVKKCSKTTHACTHACVCACVRV